MLSRYLGEVMGIVKTLFYRLGLYRAVMRVAHHYHWHYAPPCYPEGDTLLWCHWCGFRQVITKEGYPGAIRHAETTPEARTGQGTAPRAS